MRRREAGFALSLLMAVGVARADVILDGHTHHGDFEGGSFTPADPIPRATGQANPTRFHLTAPTTIEDIYLVNPVSLENLDGAWIDGVHRAGTYSASNDRLRLGTPLLLAAGVHTIWMDPGCEDSSDNPVACPGVDEDDVSYAALRFDTVEETASVNLVQRRHLGNSTDSNDDYGGRWYPDAPEGLTMSPLAASITIPFTINRNRKLTELRFYRLRDVGSDSFDHASVFVNGSFQGKLTTSGDPFVMASTELMLAGSHNVRIDAGLFNQAGTDLEDISWDDLILILTNDPEISRGPLNAVDVGQPAVAGKIKTKIAGQAFSLDIVTLSQDGNSFDPQEKEKVDVTLLDASDESGVLDENNCRSSWTSIQFLGTVKIQNADNGRKTLSGIVHNDAARVVRVKMEDVTGPPDRRDAACSTDAFTIRPNDFALQVSDADAQTAGTGRNLDAGPFDENSTPTHKAGQPFTVRATARNALGATTAGYTGTMPVAAATASLVGAVTGTASADNWMVTAGVARSDEAKYSEAGAFTLEVSDLEFAVVDAFDGSTETERKIVGTADIGRFTPDHFQVALNAPSFAPGCGNFSYIGQPLQWTTAPVATLTAVAAGTPPTPTQNYAGILFKIPALAGSSTYTAFNHAVDAAAVPIPDATRSIDGGGVSTVTFVDGGAGTGPALTRDVNNPEPPLTADIAITRTITDDDGITTSPSPMAIGAATAGNGVAFDGGINAHRYGRLRLLHGYGSELAPVPVPMRGEYFETVGGESGFVPNPLDGCTTVLAGDVTVTDGVPDPDAALATVTPLAGGAGSLDISATNRGQATVTVDLIASGVPWLLMDADNDGQHDDDPAATVTFGVHSSNEQKIYSRETFR